MLHCRSVEEKRDRGKIRRENFKEMTENDDMIK
jgi:hypothetical protein